jgi:hypothetical protein
MEGGQRRKTASGAPERVLLFRVRLLILVLAALPLAAGCGAEFEDVTAPPGTITAAVEKTSKVRSFRSTFHGVYSAPDMGWRLKFKGTGLYDARRRLASLDMRLSGSAVEGCTCQQKHLEFVFDNGGGVVAYMRGGPLVGHMPSGRDWLRIDVLRAARLKERDMRQLAQMSRSDPTQVLEQLLAAQKVREIGYDRLRNVFTTRYEVSLDLKQLAKTSSRKLRKLAKQLGYGQYTVDVWIDGSNRVRRVSMTVTTKTRHTGPMTLTATEEFHSFGKPVRIARPPASRTWDPLRTSV